MFYLRIKLICVWFKQVVCFISIKNVSVAIHIHRIPISPHPFSTHPLSPTFHDFFFPAFHELQTDLIDRCNDEPLDLDARDMFMDPGS